MPPVVLKSFARQGTGRTGGQCGDYMLSPLGSIQMASYKNLKFTINPVKNNYFRHLHIKTWYVLNITKLRVYYS